MRTTTGLIGISGSLAIVLAAGCIAPNPDYQDGAVVKQDGKASFDALKPGVDSAPPRPDGKTTAPDGKPPKKDSGPTRDTRPDPDARRRPDARPWPDTRPWPDLVPPPDFKPWACHIDADCSDGLTCTTDKCTPAKQCANTLNPGNCLVGGKCFAQSTLDPLNSCAVCAPSTSTSSFTARADGLSCTSDGISCTVDACKSGKCTHSIKSSNCLIGGACYKNNQQNPTNVCQHCKSAINQTGWSNRANNSPCTSDGLSCTRDVCAKGQCTHTVTTGCVANNRCLAEGATDPSDSCKVCISASSSTSTTFVAGKDCSTSSMGPAMCFNTSCRGFKQAVWEPAGTRLTSLRAVAHIPAAKTVWAAGRRDSGTTSGSNLGVLVDVGSVLAGTPTAITTGEEFWDINYRLAVGRGGIVFAHDGSAWNAEASIQTFLGTRTHQGVWGERVGSVDTFWITGQQTSGVNGVELCRQVSSGGFTCTGQSGVVSGAVVGPIYGAPASSSAMGPLWTAAIGRNANDDIYYSNGSASSWSRNSPQGCRDSSGTPCSSSGTEWTNINGSGASDVWVVGTAGWLLHYDGSSWSRVTNSITSQSSYQLDAVYASSKDKLVSVVGYYDSGNTRRIRLWNYNMTLKTWLSPITLRQYTSNTREDRIFDIGGEGYHDLWLVGQRRAGSGGSSRLMGWILQLQ